MQRPSFRFVGCALVLGAGFAFAPAHAGDVLLIERVEAAREIQLPRRGELMGSVESRFGAPTRKHEPVGGDRPQHPPITRWDYPDFSVYFEHSHVVNSVLSKSKPLETHVKPVG